ncbi:hypothetical protein Slin15195_G088220 [Septoria linicola]|uniref:Uncharacterized protein n=1 Tax=Septoria linicola TaxID=215465 RepID=A0A9Q9ENI2_9PEZI|nr:hypothetical protein Slin14017_G090830 [Septoria linicola]USW55503.1 hypothetical protein Slin15195_G088220 [Septoria linicola]
MYGPRAATRASRAARSSTASTRAVISRNAPRRTFADSAPAPAPQTGGGQALTGGLIGGGVVAAIGYGYYHFSGAKTIVNTTAQAKSYADSAAEQIKQQLQEMKPQGDDVLGSIRQVAEKYASFVPGGRQFVDTSFKDLEAIRNKHKEEFNEIARATYDELREAAQKKGASIETINDIWTILSKRLGQLTDLAGDASQQILDNHPELKEKLGGQFDQLKQLGDKLGPEAKKQVDDTFNEVSNIVKSGASADAATRAYKLLQEKSQELKKLGDKSWESGYEQIKPYLEKNSDVKKFVEENMETIKSGNVTDVIDKVKTAVQSGSTRGLEQYVKEGKKKADQFSNGALSSWLDAIPNGSQILPQIMKLKEAAEQKGPEAQKLGKETIEELSKVLEKKSKQAEELLKK